MITTFVIVVIIIATSKLEKRIFFFRVVTVRGFCIVGFAFFFWRNIWYGTLRPMLTVALMVLQYPIFLSLISDPCSLFHYFSCVGTLAYYHYWDVATIGIIIGKLAGDLSRGELRLGPPNLARFPNSPTGQVSEARPDGQSKLMSVTRPGQ